MAPTSHQQGRQDHGLETQGWRPQVGSGISSADLSSERRDQYGSAGRPRRPNTCQWPSSRGGHAGTALSAGATELLQAFATSDRAGQLDDIWFDMLGATAGGAVAVAAVAPFRRRARAFLALGTDMSSLRSQQTDDDLAPALIYDGNSMTMDPQRRRFADRTRSACARSCHLV
jgi:hypothetical protein